MEPLVKSIAEAAPSQVELLGSSKSFLKQSSDKLAGVEGLQIFHIFTDADVLYRNAELFLNADDHAAFGRAVELGQNNAADVGRLLENARLLKTILAGGRVEDQKRLMGRVGLLAGDDTANFFEFFDQVCLGVETAGGVNQKNVYAAAFCCLHAIENDRGRVGTRAVFDDFDAHALPLNARVWLPGGAGPFPLVVIVHGNDLMETPSDAGFAYLGELFANGDAEDLARALGRLLGDQARRAALSAAALAAVAEYD